MIDILIGTVKQGTAVSGVLIQDVLDLCQHTVAFLDLSCSQFTFLLLLVSRKLMLDAGGS